jgi:hypothetical protein
MMREYGLSLARRALFACQCAVPPAFSPEALHIYFGAGDFLWPAFPAACAFPLTAQTCGGIGQFNRGRGGDMKLNVMTSAALAASGLTLAFVAAPARADTPVQATEVYDKCGSNVNGIGSQFYARSCANASVSGTPVGNWGQISGAGTGIGNGYVDAGATNATPDQNNGYATTSGDYGWSNGASAYSNSGSVARTSSSLADGTLHAFASNPDGPWRAGFTNTRISDIVTFYNDTGSTLYLDIGYAFDGSFTSTTGKFDDGYTSGFIALALGSVVTDANTGYLKFANSGSYLGGLAQANFDANNGTFVQDYYNGGMAGDYAFTGGYDLATGIVEGTFSTMLAIPTGLSKLGFAFTLGLDCRGRGATCDFGNTGALSFGDLPKGLTYTSASGVLFSAEKAPGPVPEARSWAMMIAGLAFVGGLLRRRGVKLAIA